MTEENQAVERNTVFETDLVTVRDNVCTRKRTGLSDWTRPLPYCEVVFPRQGLWVRHVGRREIPVDATHVHWFSRNDVHRVSHPLGCGDTNTGIALQSELLSSIESELPDLASVLASHITHCRLAPRVWAFHRALLAAMRWKHPDPLEMEERVFDLIVEAACGFATWECSYSNRTHRSLVNNTRYCLCQRYSEQLSLHDVAQEVGVSAFHLSRVFRSETGMTVHQYLTRLRLVAALNLLLESSAPLVEIAAQCGFGGRSQLSRAVSTGIGMPANDLRRRAKQCKFKELAQILLNLGKQDSSHIR